MPDRLVCVRERFSRSGEGVGEIENCSNYLLEIWWRSRASESPRVSTLVAAAWKWNTLPRTFPLLRFGCCICCLRKGFWHPRPNHKVPFPVLYPQLCQAFGFVLICVLMDVFLSACKLRKVLFRSLARCGFNGIYNYNNATESGQHLKPFMPRKAASPISKFTSN